MTGEAAPDRRVEMGVIWAVNEYFNVKTIFFKLKKFLIVVPDKRK